MIESSDFQMTRIPLNNGVGHMPVLGFGTLIPDAKTPARARENLNISRLPEDALDEISGIQTRQKLNEVVKTGIPGFIAQGK
jgi:hypothetical protein